MSATATRATLDQEEIKRIIIRWRVAQEYLSDLNDSLPSEHAIRVLVGQDVPSPCFRSRMRECVQRLILAPQVGFEPTTLRLTAECCTVDLAVFKKEKEKSERIRLLE